LKQREITTDFFKDSFKNVETICLQDDSIPIKKYRGILKGKGINGRDEEKKMRDEWD